MDVKSILALRQNMGNNFIVPKIDPMDEIPINKPQVSDVSNSKNREKVEMDEKDDDYFRDEIKSIIADKPKKTVVRDFLKEYTEYLEEEEND